jgi:hypothetical protein
MPNTSKKMPIDLFCRIIDKVKEERYQAIALFSWNEPFLNRNLEDYIAEVAKRDLACWVSTTLSLRNIKNLEASLCAGISNMFISISGMDQAMNEINHVGGNIEYTLRHARTVAEIITRHQLQTIANLRFIRFDYNESHEPIARAFAAEAGLNFEVIEGVGHPSKDVAWTNAKITSQIALGETVPSAELSKSCPLLFDQITIDCDGNLYLCCALPNLDSIKIGPYLDLSEQELLKRRFEHPFCPTCTMPRRNVTEVDRLRMVDAGILTA